MKQWEIQSQQVQVRTTQKVPYNLLINPEGIHQLQSKTKKYKPLINPDNPITLRLISHQICKSQYTFVLRIIGGTIVRDVLVQGEHDLQKIFRITARIRSYIVGMQDIVASFQKIGQGAFAVVYQVITNYQQKFAVKCFEKKDLELNSKNKAAFLNQIQIMKSLHSSHLIPFDYIFQTDKGFYLKMNLLQNTLKNKIAEKLTIKTQKKFIRQLLLALVELKKQNVIHRDLKPDNVMIRVKPNQEEECVIIDFGLATKADAKEYLFFRCGTPGFLAPQIANLVSKKQRQTCAADMYSLGCIFFRMITGHYLFSGKTAKEVLNNNKKHLYTTTYFSCLSDLERSLLQKMIDPNPKTRITPEQALKDSYFISDIDDADQIPDEECGLNKQIKKISDCLPIKNMNTVNSSCSSISHLESRTSQAYRLKGKESLRDSCLTFELGLQRSSDDLLRTTNVSKESPNKKSGRNSFSNSRTPEKRGMKHSRFSKLGTDISNIL